MFKRQQQQPQQPEEQPVFETTFLGQWCKVYADRVVIKTIMSLDTIPISQIVGVNAGSTFTLTTTGGRVYDVPVSTSNSKRRELQKVILDTRTAYLASQQTPTVPQKSIADEIAKLHALWQQGIISEADFEQGKKKLLGI